VKDNKQTYKDLLIEFEKLKKKYLRDIKGKNEEIEALKQAIFKSEDAIDALPVGVVVYDKKGNVSRYNRYFTKLFGYDVQNIPSVKDWFPVAYPDEKYRKEVSNKWFAAIEEYNKTGKFTPVEARVKCKDNSYKDIEFGYEVIGETYLTTFVDLTQRKKAEKAHLKAVEFNDELIDSLPAIFFMYRLDGEDARLIKWNKNHETRLGYSAQELHGKSIFAFFEGDSIDFIASSLDKLDEERELETELSIRHASGSLHQYYFTVRAFTEPGSKFFYGIGIDISEQKKTEQALKDSEEKYRKLYENANDAIFLMKGDIFIDCNNETLQMFDCKKEQIVGETPYYFSPPKQPDGQPSKEKAIKMITSALKKEIKVFEWMHWTLKKKPFYAEVSLNALRLRNNTYIQAIVRDINERKLAEIELNKYKTELEKLVKERTDELQITNEELKLTNEELYFVNERIESQKEKLSSTLEELKNAQTQLVQTEKMASLGILTAGVSHEINNPLNYIQAGIYSLDNLINGNEEFMSAETLQLVLNHIQEGVNRVSKIVANLNSFSKIGQNKKSKCYIHKVINNCLSMLEHEFKNQCKVEKEFFDNDFVIICDEGKLHHVFTNIFLNAIHAIEKEGEILIKTALTGNGNLVQITIEDSGMGISKENLARIYDPFFTTKAPGKGTGLGLSIVFRIIKEHKGTIKYDSQINKGTKVLITLPIN